MRTLDEAWAWYLAAAQGAKRLAHLAKFWGQLPWATGAEWVSNLERDGVLRHLEADEMAVDSETVSTPLDDLAVLVLFSVFEARIRDLVELQIRPEISRLVHASLKSAGEDVLQAVAEGSFFRVLEPFKSGVDPALVEQVNQVRQFRNWVAHGRRQLPPGKQMAVVQPEEAYRRLKAFLTAIDASPLRPSAP